MSDINVQTFSGKVNITSNLLVGSSHLFVDTTNNRVGITTASPSASLDVNGDVNVGTNITFGGILTGNGSGLTSVNSDSGLWAGAGTGSVYLSTSTDNVGIGKTPSEKLDVEGIIRVNRNGGSLQLVGTDHTYIEYYPDGVSSGRKAYVGYAGGSDNNFTISNSAGSGHVILAGGSVGIGVTDPDSKLEVRGNIRASFSDTNHGMFIDAGGTILRNYGGNGAGLHFTANQIFPTNYLGAYSAGGIDLGSSSYRWNNVYTEALNASGNLTVDGTIYNHNYTEVDITAPASSSGTWTSATTSDWGDPKFNSVHDKYSYNDAPGYLQFNIPSGMKSAYISQLQWSSGGYADAYGVQSDGGLVFLRRINTHQAVENINEGNPDQHDGMTITLAGSGLHTFSAIRLVNKSGRLHLTGLGFTPNLIGTEGTGMVNPEQITGTVPAARISGTVASATNADTVDGQHAHEMSWGHDTIHGTYSDFNSFINTDKFGAHYVTGTTNGPGQSGPTQYYHQRLSLGSNHNNYSLQLAIGRGRTDNYLWYRNEEAGSASSWYKMRAGYADSAGNADTATTAGTLNAQAYINRVRPYSNSYGAGYDQSSLEIREYNLEGSAGGTEWARAPRIGFHWGGRVASQIICESNGRISVVNNPGNAYEAFGAGSIYTSGSIEADGRIYADNGLHVRGDWLRVDGVNGLYFESYGGGWFMNDSTWIQTHNSKGLYVNNQIRMASLRALGGDYATRLDWPNSGHHVDCYHNLSGHEFHINYYAQRSVYLNRTGYSDRRIKEDIKDIDDVSALNVLRKIKPKTYKYKLQPHKGTVYGFIAQDVREVLPYATNLTKLSAPFDREKFVNATILENGVVNLDKPCNELEIGKNAYFYYESSTSTRDFEVTEITSPTQFRVRIDEGVSEWIGNTILVGKEVDDFHGIDKDAIFTVATAALQEVDRQLQAEKAKTYELLKKVELLEMSHTSLIQRIEALENL